MYSEKQLFSYKGSYQLNHFDVYWMSLNHLATRKVLKNLKSVSHEWLCGYLADFLYFIKSGIFYLYSDTMLRKGSVLLWHWRGNFLNGWLVIYISDSTMPNAGSLHFSIFLYCKREFLFKKKFSSLSLDLSIDFVIFVGYLKCFAVGNITNNAFCRQSVELYFIRIVT